MGTYEPVVVMQLADVLHDVCRNLRERNGQTVSPELTDLLAKRVVALFDSGLTDPEQLKNEVLAGFARSEEKAA